MEHAASQSEPTGAKESIVPKVHLHATHEKALDVVSMEELKRLAAEPEVGNASNVAQSRKGGSECSSLLLFLCLLDGFRFSGIRLILLLEIEFLIFSGGNKY